MCRFWVCRMVGRKGGLLSAFGLSETRSDGAASLAAFVLAGGHVLTPGNGTVLAVFALAGVRAKENPRGLLGGWCVAVSR